MYIARVVPELIRSFFRRHGFDIIRIQRHCLDELELLSSLKFDNIHSHISKITCYDNIYTYRGTSIKDVESDPYLFALSRAISQKNKEDFVLVFVKSIMAKIKSNRTAADAMQLSDRKDLQNLPEWCAVLPWEGLIMSDKLKNYPGIFLKNRPGLLNSDDTNLFYNDEAWKSHANQFYSLINSIRENGFYETSWPVVNVMIKNFEFKLSLSSTGNHRMMVASMLNIDKIFIKIGLVVDYQDACMWPNVLNGTYTENEAKAIFNNYFNGSGCGSYV